MKGICELLHVHTLLLGGAVEGKITVTFYNFVFYMLVTPDYTNTVHQTCVSTTETYANDIDTTTKEA